VPALVYQVVWQRILTLFFGVDVHSTSITVASFMLGLGLGALAGGRWADRARRPATWYLLVEAGLGLFGAISLPLFVAVGNGLAGSPATVLAPVVFLLLLIPTTLMGMTLPLMCRIVTAQEHSIGQHLAWLYGANTLGAAVGAALTSYVLVGLFGFANVTYLAACLNVLLAVAVLALSRATGAGAEAPSGPASPVPTGGAPSVPAPAPAEVPSEAPAVPRSAILAFAFVSGLLALGYEIVWYRVLTCLLHGTAYVFGTILAVYLLGLGIGSLAGRRSIDSPGPLRRFGASQVVTACYTAALFGLLAAGGGWYGLRHVIAASLFTSFHPSPELASGYLDPYSLYSAIDVVLWSLVILSVPTFSMGYGFPNLVRAGSQSVERLGRSVGGIYFANIVGATLGSLGFGFFGLHYWGVQGCLILLVVAGGGLGLLSYARGSARAVARWGAVQLAAVALIVLVVPLAAGGNLLRSLHYAAFPPELVNFQALEDRSGVVALRQQEQVISQEFAAQEKLKCGVVQLFIDGAAHGELPSGGAPVADEAVAWTLSAHRAPRRVLAIGLGDGRMCLAAVRDERVQELVIVELNAALGTMLSRIPQGKELLESPKVKLIVDDGRRWLLAHPEETFDVILMWPLHAAHAHSGSLYSQEFFRLAKDHLREGGLLFLRTADLYATPRTLASVFEHVARANALEYVAGLAPLRFDAARLDPELAARLVERTDADRQTIVEATADAPLNRDLRPNSEYYLTYPYRSWLRTRGLKRADAYRTQDRAALSKLWVNVP
jgi:predicted membrane-bound spermidine synthase